MEALEIIRETQVPFSMMTQTDLEAGIKDNLAIAIDLQAMTSYSLVSHFQAIGAIRKI